jgi:cleavage and polyadenylation specificity factor subunit 2
LKNFLLMTSIVKFTAISGVTGQDPLCYILSIDSYCLLLDCGWNDAFSMDIMNKLKK